MFAESLLKVKSFEVVKKTSERYGLVREILVSLQSERL